MKHYLYNGVAGETRHIPRDITHATVAKHVNKIMEEAFKDCECLVSFIMHDDVKEIEHHAFKNCTALKLIRLSKTLQCIGKGAFFGCTSLDNCFIPSTLTELGRQVFGMCHSLELLILPRNIKLTWHTNLDFESTGIYTQIARNSGFEYEYQNVFSRRRRRTEKVLVGGVKKINLWMQQHMDHYPLHKLCYEPSVTTKQINDYLSDKDTNYVTSGVDHHHFMMPLHVLAMNPHAPSGSITALFRTNTEALFHMDRLQNTPLKLADQYNVDGLLELVNCLCIHRYNHIGDSIPMCSAGGKLSGPVTKKIKRC